MAILAQVRFRADSLPQADDTLAGWIGRFDSQHTRTAYQRAWHSLLRHCGKASPRAVTDDDVQGWLDAMSAAGA